jgi:triphosphoribosyl-dephospho-CoA synthetase
VIAALVVARGDGTEILETIDGALDDISALVGLWIKAWRTATAAASFEAMDFGVLTLGADTLNAASLDGATRLASAIGTIDAQSGGPFPRASWAGSRHSDRIEDGLKLGHISALSGGDDQR